MEGQVRGFIARNSSFTYKGQAGVSARVRVRKTDSHSKSLREWFRVIHLMLTSKKGISALQIYRYMGFGSYKTAWYMCHRVRAGLANEDFRKLMGIVEVDETKLSNPVSLTRCLLCPYRSARFAVALVMVSTTRAEPPRERAADCPGRRMAEPPAATNRDRLACAVRSERRLSQVC
jgi:hypothetical protein